jgi:hypothetical protein
MGYHPADICRAPSPPFPQTLAGDVETPAFPVCGRWAGIRAYRPGGVTPSSFSPSTTHHHSRFSRLTSLSGAYLSLPLVGTAASPSRDRRSPAAAF